MGIYWQEFLLNTIKQNQYTSITADLEEACHKSNNFLLLENI